MGSDRFNIFQPENGLGQTYISGIDPITKCAEGSRTLSLAQEQPQVIKQSMVPHKLHIKWGMLICSFPLLISLCLSLLGPDPLLAVPKSWYPAAGAHMMKIETVNHESHSVLKHIIKFYLNRSLENTKCNLSRACHQRPPKFRIRQCWGMRCGDSLQVLDFRLEGLGFVAGVMRQQISAR